MTKLTVTEEIAERIRRSEGPIELVDSQGHTIGVVRRPPTETDIQRALERASKGGTRLTWAQVAAKILLGRRSGTIENHRSRWFGFVGIASGGSDSTSFGK